MMRTTGPRQVDCDDEADGAPNDSGDDLDI